MTPDDLCSAVRAALDETERWAIEASSDRDSRTEGGEHWRWECSNCDAPVPITDVTVMAKVVECPNCESVGMDLRSVEQYPTRSVGDLPHFVLMGVEELRPVDAGYLLRYDPSSVLRRVAADRRVLQRHGPIMVAVVSDDGSVVEHLTVCAWCSRAEAEWNGVDWILLAEADDARPYESPCKDLVDLAAGYGITTKEDGTDG